MEALVGRIWGFPGVLPEAPTETLSTTGEETFQPGPSIQRAGFPGLQTPPLQRKVRASGLREGLGRWGKLIST